MTDPHPIFFRGPTELRAWFETNHDSAPDVWIGFFKAHTGAPGARYEHAVEEALCFGWIDTTVRRLDDDRYMHRFTPRRSGSQWSAINLGKFAALRKAGRVTAAGLRVFEARTTTDRRAYSYEAPSARARLSSEQLRRFRADQAAWTFFIGQAPSFRRLAAHWVSSAKQPTTGERRFRALLLASHRGMRPRPFLVTRSDRRLLAGPSSRRRNGSERRRSAVRAGSA